MKTAQLFAIALATSAGLGMAACEGADEDFGAQTENQTEVALETEAASEAMYSARLRKKICSAIVAAEGPGNHGGECTDFTYTITEFGRSTLYQKAEDARPLTLRMKVDVKNPNGGATYEAVLTGRLDDEFRLDYDAELEKTDLQAVHDYIRDLARGMEYPGDLYELEQDGNLRPVDLGDLPPLVADAFADAVRERTEWLQSSPQDQDYADYGGELPFAELLKDGQPVGYVLTIDDIIFNNSLFDGAGVLIFFDLNATAVYDVSWTG